MAVDLMGMKSFLLASDGSPEEVAAFFRAEMPENGWSESSATEDAGSFIFDYTQDERTVEIEVGTDPELGQTLIYIVSGIEDTALETVDSVAVRIVADAFMTALRDAHYAAAYDLCDPDLQAEFGSADDLGAWMQGNGILPLEWTFTSDNVVDSMRQYLGTATFAGDVELGLEVILVQVEGDWRVAGFHVG